MHNSSSAPPKYSRGLSPKTWRFSFKHWIFHANLKTLSVKRPEVLFLMGTFLISCECLNSGKKNCCSCIFAQILRTRSTLPQLSSLRWGLTRKLFSYKYSLLCACILAVEKHQHRVKLRPNQPSHRCRGLKNRIIQPAYSLRHYYKYQALPTRFKWHRNAIICDSTKNNFHNSAS